MARQRSEFEGELVSVGRAAQMLGATLPQIAALAQAGKIQMADKRKGVENAILAQSIKAYCEDLRTNWRIKRRRRLSSGKADFLLDEDLLPFPLADTIGREEALSMLSSSRSQRIQLALIGADIDALPLEMYRLADSEPLRVSRSSVIACLGGAFRADKPNEGNS